MYLISTFLLCSKQQLCLNLQLLLQRNQVTSSKLIEIHQKNAIVLVSRLTIQYEIYNFQVISLFCCSPCSSFVSDRKVCCYADLYHIFTEADCIIFPVQTPEFDVGIHPFAANIAFSHWKSCCKGGAL